MTTSTTFNSEQTQRDLPNYESRSSASSSVFNFRGTLIKGRKGGIYSNFMDGRGMFYR